MANRLTAQSFSLPFAVSVALILAALAWHWPYVSVGHLVHTDEFFSLERTLGFATQGDWWTVYSENEPSYKKPPMQYWLSAAAIEAGYDTVASLRAVSISFFGLTLLATAALAWALFPERHWIAPLAMLLVASSDIMWSHALSAMLDTGAVAFGIGALAAAVKAMRQPAYCWAVVAMIFFGALQKAPVGLVFAGVYVWAFAALYRGEPAAKTSLQSSHFRLGRWVALASIFAWPAFQSLRQGENAIDNMLGTQMVSRFRPGESSQDRSVDAVLDLFIDGEWVLRSVGFAAVFLLPLITRRRDLWAMTAVVLFFLVAMFLAGGRVYARYTLTILPILAIATAAVAFWVLPRLPWAAALAVLLLSLASGGPYASRSDLTLIANAPRSSIGDLKQIAGTLSEDELLFVCGWSRPRYHSGIISVYFSDGRPFARAERLSDVERKVRERDPSLTMPVRGLCDPASLEEITPNLVGLVVEDALSGGVLHWRAERFRF